MASCGRFRDVPRAGRCIQARVREVPNGCSAFPTVPRKSDGTNVGTTRRRIPIFPSISMPYAIRCRERSGRGRETGISRPFLPSEHPIVAIRWARSGSAGIAGSTSIRYGSPVNRASAHWSSGFSVGSGTRHPSSQSSQSATSSALPLRGKQGQVRR